MIGDNHYKVLAGESNMKRNLYEKFPQERDAIDNYFKLLEQTNKAFGRANVFKFIPLPIARALTKSGLHRLMDAGLHRFTHQTVQQVLESITDNKELQAVLAYNYVDYGVEPRRVPFLMHAIVNNGYKEGAYYPNGGPSTVVKKIVQTINDYGGKVLTSAPVEKILLDEDTGAVRGVQMKDGHTINSNVVCSGVGLMNTATKLLPPGLIDVKLDKDHECTMNGKLHSGMSGVNLFVGIKGDPKEFSLPACHYWIHPTNDLSSQAKRTRRTTLKEALEMDPEKVGPIMVGFPSSKDKAWAKNHPGKISAEIIIPAPFHWFEKFKDTFDKKTKSHGPEYEAAKHALARKIWSRTTQVLNQSGAKLPTNLDDVEVVEGTNIVFHFVCVQYIFFHFEKNS